MHVNTPIRIQSEPISRVLVSLTAYTGLNTNISDQVHNIAIEFVGDEQSVLVDFFKKSNNAY